MTDQTDLLLEQFKVGNRVQSHPATDAFMKGDRWGNVVKKGNVYVHVKMDRSGKVRQFAPENLLFPPPPYPPPLGVEPIGSIISS